MLSSAVYDHGFSDCASIHVGSLASELANTNSVCAVGQFENPLPPKKGLKIVKIRAPLSRWRSLYSESKPILAAVHRAFVILSLLHASFSASIRFGCDVVYARHGVPSLAAVVLARLKRTPLVLEINGLYSVEARSSQWPAFARHFAKLIEVFTLPFADSVVAVTDGLAREISKYHLHPNAKIFVIPNGVDTDVFRPKDTLQSRRRCAIDPRSKVICFIGNFIAWQGLQTLIKCSVTVLAAVPNALFLLVGDGPLRASFERSASSLGVVDAFRFVGKVPHAEVPDYINSADVCVAPFVSARNRLIGLSPLKLYEYMACGKPIVASDVPGVGDLLTSHRCGLAVKPDDPLALAQNIIHLLNDEPLALEIGPRAMRVAVESFSWRAISNRIESVCNTVVLGRASHAD